MRAQPDCLACFELQAQRTLRLVSADKEETDNILGAVRRYLSSVSLEATPPEIGQQVHRMIARLTGIKDPYRRIKRKCIEEALKVYPKLVQWVCSSKDRLLEAIKLAIAGNVIDFGVDQEFEGQMDLEDFLWQDLAINDYPALRGALERAGHVLFLADNAGESVFDRLLIEELGKPVTYVVKAGPIINDATRQDAERSGIGEVAQIVSSGSTMPGTLLRCCTPHFVQLFRSADLIISKGQGNYETLCDESAPIFFLLKAKCAVIARHLQVDPGSLLLLQPKLAQRCL